MLTEKRKQEIFEEITAAARQKATNLEIHDESQIVIVCMRDAYGKRVIAEEEIILCSYEQAKELVSKINKEYKEMINEVYGHYVFVTHMFTYTRKHLINKQNEPARPATFSGHC